MTPTTEFGELANADHAADRLIARIESLLTSGTVNWARTTLIGIQATVRQTARVSEAQERAVRNIELAGQRQADAREDRQRPKVYGSGRNRRYEGFGR